MAQQRILVVDDDATVVDVVRRYLERADYRVETAGDGRSALRRVAADPPDLVVLDVMLPGVDGLTVCTELCASAVPVVMLTALGAPSDRVVGLESGADDYVSKPFSPRELVLRVRSVLRRTAGRPTAPPGATMLRDGNLTVDCVAHTARLDGKPLSLTAREFDLLVHFLTNPRRAFDRAALLHEVWGWSFGDAATVTVHVRRLREKIEADPAVPARIVTVWGVGYRYEPAASR